MSTRRTIDVRHPLGVNDRFRRLGWLGLWLAARRSLGFWLTVPLSTSAATLGHDRLAGAADRPDTARYPEAVPRRSDSEAIGRVTHVR